MTTLDDLIAGDAPAPMPTTAPTIQPWDADPPAPVAMPKQFTPAAPFQPQETQGMDWKKEAASTPDQSFVTGVSNVPENAKGHLIHAAGSFLDMVSLGQPTVSKLAQEIKDTGRRTVEQNPVTNPGAQVASLAWFFLHLHVLGAAAPEFIAATAAGEGHANIMEQQIAQGKSSDEARKAANVGGAIEGAAGYGSAFAYPGVPVSGSPILNKMAGGAIGSAIQGGVNKAVDQATTGQSESAGDVANNIALNTGINAAFGVFEQIMGTPQSLWRVPDEYRPTLVKMQQIRQGVADGTIDQSVGNKAMQAAVAGGTGDTGFVSKASGTAVINPTGGVVLTPRDGAVIRSLFTGEKAPSLDSAVPEAPKSVVSTVTQTQEGGIPDGKSQGQAQAQEDLLTPAMTPELAAGAVDPSAVPAVQSPVGFSRAAIQQKLVDRYNPAGNETAIAAASELDRIPYAQVWRGSSTADLPEEVQNAIQANPELRRAITLSPNGPTGGPDAFHELGDKYFALLGQVAQTKAGTARAAIADAHSSQDPEAAFLAALHDDMPAPQDQVPQTVIEPSKDLGLGDQVQIQGRPFQVIEDADGNRSLKDGDDFPETPIDALGKIPIDKAFDIQSGETQDAPTWEAPPEDTPTEQELSGISEGLFGQGIIQNSGIGEQQPMFHRPVDVQGPAQNPEDAAIGKRFNPAATPSMFRQGAVNTKLFTAPVESLVTQDIVPSAKAVGQVFASAKEDLQRTFAPQTRGAAAKFAKGALREAGSELDRRDAIAEKAFKRAEGYFESQPKQDNLNFYTAVETGQPVTNPHLKSASTLLRDAFQQRYDQMDSLGIAPSYVQDYLPHLYTDQAKAASFARDFLARRPMEGTKFFKKQRVFPTLQDAVTAGLEPKSYNPMTMARLALHQMDKYITVSRVKAELATAKMRVFVPGVQKPPDGWAMTTDRADAVLGKSAQNETVIRGRYAYPEPVVNLIDNYLSPGIGNRQWYRGLMWIKNNMNLFNLGYSGFHITFTTLNSFASKIGTSIQYLGDGNLRMAALKASEIPFAPMIDMVRGSKLLSEWVKPGSAGHDYAQAVDAYLAGGGSAKRPAAYENTIIDNFAKALGSGNVVGAVVRIPAAGAQLISKGIMSGYVPRIKNGAAIDQLRMELDRIKGPIKRSDLREIMGKIVDRQDDLFGELQYRNLFWNKIAHQISQLLVRAPGWTGGSIRMGAHVGADTLNTPRRVAKGGPAITLSMGRAIGVALVTAALGALIQKIFSGKDPEDAKDLVYPRTGDKDRQGNDVRLKLPTYANEAMSWYHHPLSTAEHKLSPLVSQVMQAMTNRDYYGNQITDPKSPLEQQAKDYAAFFGKQQLPFSVQSQLQLKGEGASVGTRVLSNLGVGRAPAEMIRSDALNLAYQFAADNRSVAGLTPQQVAKSQLKMQIEDAMIKSRPDGIKMMQQALAEKQITPMDVRSLVRGATETALQYKVKGETADQAAQVFAAATDDERSAIFSEVISKIDNSEKRGTIQPDVARSMRQPLLGWRAARRKAG